MGLKGGLKGGALTGGALKGGALKGGALKSWEAQKFALSFPSPTTIFFHSSLSWGSSRGILVEFEAPGPEMFTFGVLGLLERETEKKRVKFWAVRRRRS